MHKQHAYTLLPTWRGYDKMSVMSPTGDLMSFGGKYVEDFTNHKDELRRINFLARCDARERKKWQDPNTSAFWLRWLLYNKPTIAESIADIEETFGIKIQIIEDETARSKLMTAINGIPNNSHFVESPSIIL